MDQFKVANPRLITVMYQPKRKAQSDTELVVSKTHHNNAGNIVTAHTQSNNYNGRNHLEIKLKTTGKTHTEQPINKSLPHGSITADPNVINNGQESGAPVYPSGRIEYADIMKDIEAQLDINGYVDHSTYFRDHDNDKDHIYKKKNWSVEEEILEDLEVLDYGYESEDEESQEDEQKVWEEEKEEEEEEKDGEADLAGDESDKGEEDEIEYKLEHEGKVDI